MPLRFDQESEYHFTTFNTYKNHHTLTYPGIPEILIEHLEIVRNKHKFLIFGFVVMPNHMHIIWYVPANKGISNAVKHFKGSAGRHVVAHIFEKTDFNESLITQPNGKRALWQRGFYDFNLITEKKMVEKLEYVHNNPVRWGLVQSPGDWAYSSYRSWYDLPGSLFEVDRF